MSMMLFLLVASGAAMIAVTQLSTRFGQKGRRSPLPFLAVGFSAVTLLLLFTYWFWWDFTWPRNLAPGFWNAVAVGTIANYGIQYFSGKAATYKSGEVSFTAPLGAMTPGLITLMALALGEIPGWAGFFGILLMMAGSWIILAPDKAEGWTDYVAPLYRLKLIIHYSTLSSEQKELAVVAWLALGGAALGTVGLLCDGLYTRRGGDMQGLWLALITLVGMLSIGYWIQLFFSREARAEVSEVLWETRFGWALFVFTLAWVAHVWLIQPAYAEAYVAYVGTLKRMSLLLTVPLGLLIFNEQKGKRRLLAATLVVAGVLCIYSEDLPARLTHRIELFGF